MEKQCCCPHGSWPVLQVDYQSKGQIINIADTTCYHSGQGDKVLLMVSDIFGATSGRHQSFADTWASFGYNVYLPEIYIQPYKGQMVMEDIVASIKNQDFNIMKSRFQAVVKHIESKGQKRFFCVGFCWGVWFAFKMAAQFDNIISIGGFHPSLGVQNMFGGNVNDLTQKVKCPAFMFPAGNDPQDIKPNGDVINILKEKFGEQKTGSLEFPQMSHGWVVRGDVKDENVKRDVNKAINHCKEYFAKF